MVKKKKNSASQQPMSPERYIRERGRQLPIYKCYINEGWDDVMMATILVVRQHPQGTFTVGFYFVDLFCRGLADGFYQFSISQSDFDDMLEQLNQAHDMVEADYPTVHNLIYGGIEFAEEAGIKPCKEWATLKYILDDDTDDIPLIEFDYGKNDHHLLTVPSQEMHKYDVANWEKTLGEDVALIVDGVAYNSYSDYLERKDEFDDEGEDEYDDDEYDDYDEYDDDDDDDMQTELTCEDMQRIFTIDDPNERKRLVKMFTKQLKSNKSSFNKGTVSEYTYKHPVFPTELVVKCDWLYDTLCEDKLSDDEIDRILALPAEQLRADLCAVIYYCLGMVYNEEFDEAELPLLNSIVLLGWVGDDSCREAIFEVLRCDYDTVFNILGYGNTLILCPSLYAVCKDNLSALVNFIKEKGIDEYGRLVAIMALICETFGRQPERHDELLGYGEELIDFMTENKDNPELVGGYAAATLCSCFAQIDAGCLRSKLEEFYVCGCVDENRCGKIERYREMLDMPDFSYEISSLDPHEFYVNND